jgi:thymidylate kinase
MLKLKRIDLCGYDSALREEVAALLSKKLNENGLITKVVNKHDTLFAKAIRLIKTYMKINITRTTNNILDAAIENANLEANHHDFYDKKTTIISSWSFFVGMFYYMYRMDVKKNMSKYLARMISIRPDYIVYLNVDPDMYRKKSKGYMRTGRKRDDDILRAGALSHVDRHFNHALQRIFKRWKIESCIIDIKDGYDLNMVVDEIVLKISLTETQEKENDSN